LGSPGIRQGGTTIATQTKASNLGSRLALLARTKRVKIAESLSDDEAKAVLHEWKLWARPSQLAPKGDWLIWFLMAGRGFGKTRSGAEETINQMREPGAHFALVSKKPADARDVMIEGEAGILAFFSAS